MGARAQSQARSVRNVQVETSLEVDSLLVGDPEQQGQSTVQHDRQQFQIGIVVDRAQAKHIRQDFGHFGQKDHDGSTDGIAA